MRVLIGGPGRPGSFLRSSFRRLLSSPSSSQHNAGESSVERSEQQPIPGSDANTILRSKTIDMEVSTMKPRAGELSLERKERIPHLDEITLKNQAESPFLRLPGEIRNRIYHYAVGRHQIYAMIGGYRKGYTLMSKPMDSIPWKLEPISQSLAINLPLACRQTYFETNLLLFELNSFGTVLIDGFLPLSNGFSEAQRKIVQEVRLPMQNIWLEDKVPLEKFPGLKRVVVRTFSSGYPEMHQSITTQVRNFVGRRDVHVELEIL